MGRKLFFNGRIYTANTQKPWATAMLVENGRIVWVGDEKDFPQIEGESINLNGKRVLPGFIDAHQHPLMLANAAKQIACVPPSAYSIRVIIEQIKERIAATGKNQWIEGWGYDEGKLEEARTPDRWDLDQASLEIPIVLTRTCTHIISVNSKVLELAGIDRNTPDPVGGQIDRDEQGEPTGVLRETARNLIFKVMPVMTVEEQVKNLIDLSHHLLQHGITGITEMMGRKLPADYYGYFYEAAANGFKPRIVMYYMIDTMGNDFQIDRKRTDLNYQIAIGGVKLFTDGSISGRTAWMNTPYLGGKEIYGIQTISKKEILEGLEIAKQNHVQLAIHAMGNQAIDFVVDVLADEKGWLEDGPSIRIEHVSIPSNEALEKISQSDMAIVTQPIFQFAEIESYLNNIGEERTKRAYPVKTMLEKGILIAFSSDAPATTWADPVNPFVGIKAAVTRRAYNGTDLGQNQKIDVETAIRLYTTNAQKITRIPDVGQLLPSYHADFIILDRDVFSIPAEEINQIIVEQTYMSGEKVFDRNTIKQ